MSISHLIILGIIILVVVPPEKLPEIMRNIGRLINDIKRQTNGIWDNVNTEIKSVKTDINKDLNTQVAVEPNKKSSTTSENIKTDDSQQS